MRVLKYKKTARKRLHSRHATNVEREKMHISKGDTVRVMRGDYKGKEGKVIRVFPKNGRALARARQRGATRQLLPALDIGERQRAQSARHLGKRQIGQMTRLERGNPAIKFLRVHPNS